MNKLLVKLFSIIYLVSIILYVSQGILFEGTWFTFLSGVYLLGYGLLCTFIVVLKRQHPSLFNVILIFMLWTLFLWVFSPKYYFYDGEKVSTATMILYVFIICSSVSAFYFIGLNQSISKILLKVFTVVLGAIFVYNILHFDVSSLEEGEYDYTSANNKSYLLAALFPFLLLFWGKKWLMFLLMLASTIFVVFLLKRGAMICVGVCLLAALYFSNKEKNSFKKRATIRTIFMRILALMSIGVVFYVLFNVYQENVILQARLDSGSSGRDKIYSRILNVWNNSDFYLQLIGYGPFSTIPLAKIYAHNDWLELLLDFGLIGLSLYIAIISSIIRFYKKNNLDFQQKAAIVICVLFIIIKSTFSMCIYQLESILVFGFMGYTIGMAQITKQASKKAIS